MDKLNTYKILIVEDEETARHTVRSYFERRWGAAIWDVANGEEALEIVRDQGPDVMLLDVMIEGRLNGWQVIDEVRKFNAAIKIILVTGQLEIEPQLQARADQVAAVLQKPASLSEVESKVIEVLGGNPQTVMAVALEHPASDKKASYEARKLVHAITNVHNVIRMRCERFVLDHEEGRSKDHSDKVRLEEAVKVLKSVIQKIDEVKGTVEQIRDL